MNDFYILVDGKPNGPHTVGRLQQMLERGEMPPETPCCRDGASAWGTLRDAATGVVPAAPALPPALPPASALQPAPLPTRAPQASAANEMAQRFAGKSVEVSGLAKLFARRILASNFTVESASGDERQALLAASTPVEPPIAQNYAAWRRAILWFSGVGLSVAALFQIAQTFRILFDGRTLFAVKMVVFLLFAFQVLAPVLALWGAWRWMEIKESRRLARFSYLCQLLGPMLVFCVPLAWFISGSPQELVAVRGVFALAAVFTLLPKVFAIFPGLIRACLTLRTLLPESPMPGWICMLVAPLYCLFFALIVIVAGQAGSPTLFGGFIALLLAPLFVVLDARKLCAPMDEAGMNVSLAALRSRIFITTVVGLVLVAVASYSLISEMNVGVGNVLSIGALLVGNIFLLTLVAADFLTGLMRSAFEQDMELVGGPLHAQLRARFTQLANVRMADLTAGESMLVRNVGDLVRRARGGN